MQDSFLWLRLGAFLGSFSVVLGAFGAHYLKTRLSLEQLSSYQTAVSYQFFHALVFLFLPLLMARYPHSLLNLTAVFFTLGTFLFSGSIYMLLFFGGTRSLALITPLGGSFLIIAWILLFISTWFIR